MSTGVNFATAGRARCVEVPKDSGTDKQRREDVHAVEPPPAQEEGARVAQHGHGGERGQHEEGHRLLKLVALRRRGVRQGRLDGGADPSTVLPAQEHLQLDFIRCLLVAVRRTVSGSRSP